GLVGLAVAVAAALFVFGLGVTRLPAFGPAGSLGGAALEALFTTATILWIVLPALALYELQSRSGALATLRAAISRLSVRPRTQVLLVAFFFGLFMEGAAGFGAPVALTAPLLAALGHPPIRAVTLALLGHAAGVSFGALGTPVLAQETLTGLSGAAIARDTALLHVLAGWTLLVALVWLADDHPPRARDWLTAALAAACFYVPFLATAVFTGPELPTVAGALIGAGVFAVLIRRERSADAEVPAAALARAAAPYLIVVALVLLTRLWPLVREVLRSVEIAWSLGGTFGGAVQPLYHSGSLLVLGFLLGGLVQRRTMGQVAEAAIAAGRRLGGVALALVVMLALSRVMVHGGLIAALGAGVTVVGGYWPLFAPSLGALGSFVTGSATASNILLTPFQQTAAAQLGLSAQLLASGQGYGAAVGNIICPHNVIAGAATVGLQGREGEILRRTAPPAVAAALLGGVILVWLTAS
ncbi:MAG: L-lactate permease, partial [Pseudomonadota bacterium]